MTGNRTCRTTCGGGGAIARGLACALLALLALGIAPAGTRAATVLYDFSAPPDSPGLSGSPFSYNAPAAPPATFAGLQYDDSGIFPDHTNGVAGALFGAGPGPAVITFASPVELVELFVNNVTGSEFDDRPGDFKLFTVSAFLGSTPVYTYDRAAESAPGSGVAFDFLRIAPATPVMIDSISLSNFDQDTLDDLKVNVVPEPAGVLAWGAGALAVAAAGRRGRERAGGTKWRGGHAPERDPPRDNSGGRFTTNTQANQRACAETGKIPGAVSTEAVTSTCT
jgi:hypothetical protein